MKKSRFMIGHQLTPTIPQDGELHCAMLNCEPLTADDYNKELAKTLSADLIHEFDEQFNNDLAKMLEGIEVPPREWDKSTYAARMHQIIHSAQNGTYQAPSISDDTYQAWREADIGIIKEPPPTTECHTTKELTLVDILKGWGTRLKGFLTF